MQTLHELGRTLALRQALLAEHAAHGKEQRPAGGRGQRVRALTLRFALRGRACASALICAAYLKKCYDITLFLFFYAQGKRVVLGGNRSSNLCFIHREQANTILLYV